MERSRVGLHLGDHQLANRLFEAGRAESVRKALEKSGGAILRVEGGNVKGQEDQREADRQGSGQEKS
jgi:hypothetical protein